MYKNLVSQKIDLYKHQVIDSTLLIASIIGTASFLLIPSDQIFNLFRLKINILSFDTITDFLTILLAFSIYLFRKRIKILYKTWGIFIILFNLVLTDLLVYGLYSFDKVFIVVIPFYSLMVLSLRKTIIVYALIMIAFFIVAYLFITEKLVVSADMFGRSVDPGVWIESFVIISVGAAIVVVFSTKYNNNIAAVMMDLEEKNEKLSKNKSTLEKTVLKRTVELENANLKLKKTNDNLSKKSKIIHNKNAELKTTMEHLKNTQSQLVQADKMASLGVLTAGVAHEINNPLNYILGGYTGLERYFHESGKEDKEEIAILLNSIKTGVDRASDIVTGLNQFSRSKDSYDEDCDIHSIIDNCLVMLSGELKSRIDITKNFTPEAYFLKGNVGKLHQAFINILSNASHAISLEGSISISTTKLNNIFIVEVQDTGHGISSDDLTKITDPFFTTKDPGKGTGLGLSITYAIIDEHKGKMEFFSELNKGTKVKVTLPLN